MDEKAKVLAEMIDKKGSRRSFAEEIGIPPSTLNSMLNRGVGRASIDNVIKVCRALGITVEDLERMAGGQDGFDSIAAHHEGEDWTEEELEEIEEFKQFVLSKRKEHPKKGE